MQNNQISHKLIILNDLPLFMSHIFRNNTVTPKEQPLGEVIELFTFIGSRMNGAPELHIANVLQ